MNNLPKVLEQKVFYVIRNQDYNVAQQICEMLINLQVTCLELTFIIPKVELLIKALRKKYPTILIGAGTVLTLAEAILAAEAGAHFLVGPVLTVRLVIFVIKKDYYIFLEQWRYKK